MVHHVCQELGAGTAEFAEVMRGNGLLEVLCTHADPRVIIADVIMENADRYALSVDTENGKGRVRIECANQTLVYLVTRLECGDWYGEWPE
jgi:hypothetical protein